MAKKDNMLFHEVYGTYYHTVAKILSMAVQGNLTRTEISGIVQQYAFSESQSSLTESLFNGNWPFLNKDLETELMYPPQMPLTTLQRRWLKTMLSDPRIHLFLDPEDVTGLEDVQPLFRQEDICYFDQYADGDPYQSEAYRKNFRLILTALREKHWLEISQRNRWGTEITQRVYPLYLEYSPRDNKFRLHSAGTSRHIWPGNIQTNLERILSCRIVQQEEPHVLLPSKTQIAELILSDRRGVLDRFMRLFCWMKKTTVPLEAAGDVVRYRVTLYYEKADEPELVIRLLSMGPDIEILAPSSLREETLRRVRKQAALFP